MVISMNDNMIKLKEASKITGKSIVTLRRMIKDGKIEAEKKMSKGYGVYYLDKGKLLYQLSLLTNQYDDHDKELDKGYSIDHDKLVRVLENRILELQEEVKELKEENRKLRSELLGLLKEGRKGTIEKLLTGIAGFISDKRWRG
jgi:hypothetical protein